MWLTTAVTDAPTHQPATGQASSDLQPRHVQTDAHSAASRLHAECHGRAWRIPRKTWHLDMMCQWFKTLFRVDGHASDFFLDRFLFWHELGFILDSGNALNYVFCKIIYNLSKSQLQEWDVDVQNWNWACMSIITGCTVQRILKGGVPTIFFKLNLRLFKSTIKKTKTTT